MSWFENLFKKKKRKPYTEDALGHNHEWDDMYHTDKNGKWTHKKGWVFCWICQQTKLWV